jgi:hypothetical protein
MTAARQLDSVRLTAPAVNLFDGRIVPEGMVGAVLAVMSDGTCLVELAFRPQTADQDGDFAQAMVAEDQYEIIAPWSGNGCDY